MKFIALADMPDHDIAAVRETPEYRKLVGFLVDWFRAGGTPGPIAELDPVEVAAAIDAGKKLQAERALQLVSAFADPFGASRLTVDIDGGETHDELVCRTVSHATRMRLHAATRP